MAADSASRRPRGAGERDRHPLGQPLAGPAGHGLDEPLPVTEVVVDESAGDPGGVGDLLERHPGGIASVEDLGGGVDQELASLLAGQARARTIGGGPRAHPAPFADAGGATSPINGKWQATK